MFWVSTSLCPYAKLEIVPCGIGLPVQIFTVVRATKKTIVWARVERGMSIRFKWWFAKHREPNSGPTQLQGKLCGRLPVQTF